MSSFLTIKSKGEGEGLYKEKGSRFLGFSFRVETKDQVEKYLTQLRKDYYDARHHCYAWILGPDKEESRTNDDGEPRHSAGDPILGQIRSRHLTNVLVVVVRYFGGTKLGVSGLIHAYKSAADEALENSKILKIELKKPMKITYAYEATNEIMRLVEELEIEIIKQEFNEECFLSGKIRLSSVEKLKLAFELYTQTGVSAQLSID